MCRILHQLILIARPDGGTVWSGWMDYNEHGGLDWLPGCMERVAKEVPMEWEIVNENKIFGASEYVVRHSIKHIQRFLLTHTFPPPPYPFTLNI